MVTRIEVPENIYQDINDDDKEKIKNIIQQEIGEDITLEEELNNKNFFCETACKATAAAGYVACAKLSGPAAAACIIAVNELKNKCLRKC